LNTYILALPTIIIFSEDLCLNTFKFDYQKEVRIPPKEIMDEILKFDKAF